MIYKHISTILTLICSISSLQVNAFIFNELAILSELNRQNRAACAQAFNELFSPTYSNISESSRDLPFPVASLDDLPGMPDELYELVDFLHNPEKFTALGAQMPRGIILYGPPGTGKTSVARIISQQTGASFFHASGSQFIELYVGVGPQRIRELFNQARACDKAIIFIDEIDAIGGQRSSLGNSEYTNTLNELLNQMDGFSAAQNIVVIGATNRIDILDEALIRPGRFDRHIYLGLPSKQARIAILKHYCRTITCTAQDETLSKIATRAERFSGADLKNLVNEAAIHAARDRKNAVDDNYLMAALEQELKRVRKTKVTSATD